MHRKKRDEHRADGPNKTTTHAGQHIVHCTPHLAYDIPIRFVSKQINTTDI